MLDLGFGQDQSMFVSSQFDPLEASNRMRRPSGTVSPPLTRPPLSQSPPAVGGGVSGGVSGATAMPMGGPPQQGYSVGGGGFVGLVHQHPFSSFKIAAAPFSEFLEDYQQHCASVMGIDTAKPTNTSATQSLTSSSKQQPVPAARRRKSQSRSQSDSIGAENDIIVVGSGQGGAVNSAREPSISLDNNGVELHSTTTNGGVGDGSPMTDAMGLPPPIVTTMNDVPNPVPLGTPHQRPDLLTSGSQSTLNTPHGGTTVTAAGLNSAQRSPKGGNSQQPRSLSPSFVTSPMDGTLLSPNAPPKNLGLSNAASSRRVVTATSSSTLLSKQQQLPSSGALSNDSSSLGSEIIFPSLAPTSSLAEELQKLDKDQLIQHIVKTHEMMSKFVDVLGTKQSQLRSEATESSAGSSASASIPSSFLTHRTASSAPQSMFSFGGTLNGLGSSINVPGMAGSVNNLSFHHARSIASIMSYRRRSIRTTQELTKTVDEDGSKLINDYIVLDDLGRGAHGKVKLAYCPHRNTPVAIKIIRRSRVKGGVACLDEKINEALQREIAVMKKLRHKNIVSLNEVIDDPNSAKLYLVMQYVDNGPVRSVSSDGSCETIDPERLAVIMRQVCAGLRYLHDRKIVHRDLKPENILVASDETAYLADFGVSEICEAERQQSGGENGGPQRKGLAVHGHSGTLNYMAPELFEEGVIADGELVDMWALGVTCFTLLTGKQPFFGITEIREADLPEWSEATKAIFSGEWVALIEGMLQRDVSKRMGLREVRRRIKQMVPVNPLTEDLGLHLGSPNTTSAKSPTPLDPSEVLAPNIRMNNDVPRLTVDVSNDEVSTAFTPIVRSNIPPKSLPDFDKMDKDQLSAFGSMSNGPSSFTKSSSHQFGSFQNGETNSNVTNTEGLMLTPEAFPLPAGDSRPHHEQLTGGDQSFGPPPGAIHGSDELAGTMPPKTVAAENGFTPPSSGRGKRDDDNNKPSGNMLVVSESGTAVPNARRATNRPDQHQHQLKPTPPNATSSTLPIAIEGDLPQMVHHRRSSSAHAAPSVPVSQPTTTTNNFTGDSSGMQIQASTSSIMRRLSDGSDVHPEDSRMTAVYSSQVVPPALQEKKQPSPPQQLNGQPLLNVSGGGSDNESSHQTLAAGSSLSAPPTPSPQGPAPPISAKTLEGRESTSPQPLEPQTSNTVKLTTGTDVTPGRLLARSESVKARRKLEELLQEGERQSREQQQHHQEHETKVQRLKKKKSNEV